VYELSQASVRYAALIAASNTGAWEYHANTGYLWCSPEYFSMHGRDISVYDLTGKRNIEETWHSLLHPDDRIKAIETFDAYLKQPDGMYEQYFRMLHSDGHYVWIWSRGRTILDEDNTPTPITVGTHIDITGRKLAEEHLKEVNTKLERQTETLSILNHIISVVNKTRSLNELLQVFLDSTHDLFRYDGGGIYLVDNESDTASLAYSKNLPDEFLNPLRTVSIRNHPFDFLFVLGKPLISDDYPAISNHGKNFGIQSIASIPLKAKDRIIGAFNIASFSMITIADQDLKPLESICAELGNTVLRMQTEEALKRAYDKLKASGEELKEKQEQLIEVAEVNPGAIFQFSANTDGPAAVTYISKRAEELFGYSGDTKNFLNWFTGRVDIQDRDSFLKSL
jgi:PAS domain S-box-containing protein